jgi:creatinine amidohydrolase
MTDWNTLRSPELAHRAGADPAGWVVLLPLGAIEQHGPHLPVDVDIHCATEVCRAVAAADDRVLVAPPVPWGVSHSHMGFAGTISLRPETLLQLLRDVCGSILASGFRGLVLVNGHNGNKYMAGQVVAELPRAEGVFLGFVTYFDLALSEFRRLRHSPVGGEAHAGELETSLELFLRPERVSDDRPLQPVPAISESGFLDLAARGPLEHGFGPMARTFPRGVMGDAVSARAELGGSLFAAAVAGLAGIVTDARAYVQARSDTEESGIRPDDSILGGAK